MRLTIERVMSVQQHVLPTRSAAIAVFLGLLLLVGCSRGEEARPLPTAVDGEPQVVAVTAMSEATNDPSEPGTEDADTATEGGASAAAIPAAGATEASREEQPASDTATSSQPNADGEATATPLPEPTATPDVTSGSVVLWHPYAGADGDALAAILAELRRRDPNLAVETLFVGYDDLPQAYADAVLAGGGPDLVAAPTWWLTQMVDAKVVQSLDELVEPGFIEAYYPATLEALTRDDALYGLPLTYELVGLFMNRALAGEEEAPMTTDELLARAQSQPEQGTGFYSNLFHLAWGLPAFGADLIDQDGVVVLDQGEGTADFMNWLKVLNDTPGAYVNEDYGMLLDRFKKGEFAYFADGPWAIEELRGALGDDLVVAVLPAGPNGPAQPWLSADGVLINPNKPADQQRRALRVAAGLTDSAAGTIWSERARRLPANRNAKSAGDPLLEGFARQAESAQPLPHEPEMDAVWGYAGDMLLKVLNNVMSPTEAVIEATALINEANGK